MAVIHLKPEQTRRPGPYPPGRVCASRHCIARLSVYNPGPRCFIHSPAAKCSHAEHADAFAELLDLPDQAA